MLKVAEWQLQLRTHRGSGHKAGALSHSAGERCVHRAEPCELQGSDDVDDEGAAAAAAFAARGECRRGEIYVCFALCVGGGMVLLRCVGTEVETSHNPVMKLKRDYS